MPTLFPFADYWWFYTLFTLGVLGLLVLDLGVTQRNFRGRGQEIRLSGNISSFARSHR